MSYENFDVMSWMCVSVGEIELYVGIRPVGDDVVEGALGERIEAMTNPKKERTM